MGTNPIANSGAAVISPASFNTHASIKQQAKDASAANNQSTIQAAQSKVASSDVSNNVTTANKTAPVFDNVNSKKSPRTMSHIVESYNAQGKVRIKYMDSNNNVIYQIPPEMVAKTQDLMTSTQTATNVKG